ARVPYLSSTQDGEKCSAGLKRTPGRRRYQFLGKRGSIWRRLDAGDGQSRRATSPPKAPTPTANWFRTKRHASSTPPTMTPTSPLRFSPPPASLWAPITVAAWRTLHLRFNDLDDPKPIPRDTDYASVFESCQSSSNTRDSIRSAPKSPFCQRSPTPK